MLKGFSLGGLVIIVSTLLGCTESSTKETTTEDFSSPTPMHSDWQLVWQDEFDGTSINNQYWTHEVNCDGGGNDEKQCYTNSPDNSFVKDGILNIVVLKANTNAEKPYTSARLNSRYKADFKYGRFDIRAKLPTGQGSWPAIWMLPTDQEYGGWPQSGEIDIMEAVNLKVKNSQGIEENRIHGTLHYGSPWPNNVYTGKDYQLPNNANPADGFHVYTVEWQQGEIRWYVDGELYALQRASELALDENGNPTGYIHRGWYTQYESPQTGEPTLLWSEAPYDKAFHLLLNFAVGGNWPENVNNRGIDASAFENGQMFKIDYVRVYQCARDFDTGKGCETLPPDFQLQNVLVQGKAPLPIP